TGWLSRIGLAAPPASLVHSAVLLHVRVPVIVVAIAGVVQAVGNPGPVRDRVRRHLAYLSASRHLAAGTIRRRSPPPAAPVTYYVDAVRGSNASPGTSPDRAWRTIARVNHGRYGPGDTIFFRGGQIFSGGLRFTPRNASGTPAAPITVASFGAGRATLAGHRHSTLVARNVAGFHITNLNLLGERSRPCHEVSHGILFESGGTNTPPACT